MTTHNPFIESPDQHIDPEGWLAWRRLGIGGSDVGALLGEDKYKSLFQLWQDKVGLDFSERDEKLMLYARAGKLYEPIAADLFTGETGMKVRRMNRGMVHPDCHNWRMTLDRRIVAQDDGRGSGTLEIKTLKDILFRKMLREGARRKDILQFHSNAAITGDSWGGLFYFNRDTTETKWFPLAADQEIQSHIQYHIEEFWGHVKNKIPPDLDKKLDTEIKLPDAGGEVTSVDDPRLRLALDDFDQANEIIKDATDLKQSARESIEILMKEHDAKCAEGFNRRIYYRDQPGRKSLDKVAFSHAHPEINLAHFQKVGQPSIYFRIFQTK